MQTNAVAVNRLPGFLSALFLVLILAVPAGIIAACSSQSSGVETGPATAPEAGECGKLCDNAFWATASRADVEAELGRGVDLASMDGDLGGAPLHVAVTSGTDPQAVAALLDAGAALEARSGDLNATPLHMAVAFNPDPAMTALLLDRGADIHSQTIRGRTPLLVSVGMNSNPAVPALLIDRGADYENGSPSAGLTMNAAAFNTNPAMVAMMLERGADPAAPGANGRTPLHTAARHNPNPAVLLLLLANGADIEAKSDAGLTPLHSAAELNPEPAAAVKTLLDRGANPNAVTGDGRTACGIARDANRDGETLALLCR